MGCIEKREAFAGDDDSDDSSRASQSHGTPMPSAAAATNAKAAQSTTATHKSAGGHSRSRRDPAPALPVKKPDMGGMSSMFGGGKNKTFNASDLPVMCS
jgi:hypothetical protein